MTHDQARERAREKAEILADQICGCANREQHRRDVKLVTAALLRAMAQGIRESEHYITRTANRARAAELEAMAKEIDHGEVHD